MQKQYIVVVDTDQEVGAVQAFDTSKAPVTVPPISATCVPVAQYDNAKEVLGPIEDAINYGLLEAVRGS